LPGVPRMDRRDGGSLVCAVSAQDGREAGSDGLCTGGPVCGASADLRPTPPRQVSAGRARRRSTRAVYTVWTPGRTLRCMRGRAPAAVPEAESGW
jgi:hypothetical protein